MNNDIAVSGEINNCPKKDECLNYPQKCVLCKWLYEVGDFWAPPDEEVH